MHPLCLGEVVWGEGSRGDTGEGARMVGCVLRATEAPQDWGRDRICSGCSKCGWMDSKSKAEQETVGNRYVWKTGGCPWTWRVVAASKRISELDAGGRGGRRTPGFQAHPLLVTIPLSSKSWSSGEAWIPMSWDPTWLRPRRRWKA